MDKNKNHQISAIVSDDLFKKIKALSAETGKSISSLMKEGFEDLLETYKQFKGG